MHNGVVFVEVGRYRIGLTAYNPTDALSLLYCRFALARAVELLDGTDEATVHAWIREHMPEAGRLLDHAEAGGEFSPSFDPPDYPVTPGEEGPELRIIARLQREARRQRAYTRKHRS